MKITEEEEEGRKLPWQKCSLRGKTRRERKKMIAPCSAVVLVGTNRVWSPPITPFDSLLLHQDTRKHIATTISLQTSFLWFCFMSKPTLSINIGIHFFNMRACINYRIKYIHIQTLHSSNKQNGNKMFFFSLKKQIN